MKTKDQLLLEQAYQSIREAGELALKEPKKSNPLKDQFELDIHYIDQSEADSDKPKKEHMVLGHKQGTELNSLDAVCFAVQEKADELLQAGKLWIRFFVSKKHNADGSTAQMMDVPNIITLIQNDRSKHILWRCYGPGAKREGTVPIKGQFADRTETLKSFMQAQDALEEQYPQEQYD